MNRGATVAGPGWVDRAVSGWMAACHARPRVALGVLGVLVVLAVVAATRLGIDADSSRMLSPDLPDQRRAHELNEKFPNLKQTILVTVDSAQPDIADLAVARLVEALETSPAIARVFAPSADPWLAAHGFLYGDLDEVEASLTRLNKSSNLLARLRSDRTLDGFADALSEALLLADRAEIGPDALDRLFAEAAAVFEADSRGQRRAFTWSTVMDDDRTGAVTRLISVLPVLDTARLSPARPALEAVEAAAAALPDRLKRGVRVAVTGEPALRAEEMRSVVTGIGLSLALSLVLVLVILRLGLGTAARAGLGLASLVVSLILTTGIAAITVGTLNLISVAFIVLMVGLGIDFAIHILAHLGEMRRLGTPPAEAVAMTGRRTGLALGLSALTTALAFLAFAWTDFHGMAQLGVIGSAGVLIAFATAATLIPAATALRPAMTGRAGEPETTPRATLSRLRPPAALAPALILALAAAALWPASMARFDADPMALRNPASPSVIAFRELAETPETSPYRTSVLAATAEDAAAIAARLDGAPGVAGAVVLADLVPGEQDEKLALLDLAAPSIDHAVLGQPTPMLNDGEDAPDRLAALNDRLASVQGMGQRLRRALTAYQSRRDPARDAAIEDDLFLAFPLMVSRLEAMLSADYVTADTLPEPMRERFLAADGTRRVEILPEADLTDPAAAARFADTVQARAPDAAGGPVQLVAAGRSVAEAMLRATLLAAAMTLVLAFAATRRATDAAAILLPLAVAGIITAAASTLLGLPFNYANVIVLPLMIGIGVDSGIHIALRERSAPGAVFATSTPRAVVVSALTTIAAFGTLALSDHRGTASMGILLAISISATMLAVLALTSALIRWSMARDTAR